MRKKNRKYRGGRAFSYRGRSVNVKLYARVVIDDINRNISIPVNGNIPHELMREIKGWSAYQILEMENRLRSPYAWDWKIRRNIEDQRLQAWCAKVIWFEFSDCKEQKENKYDHSISMDWRKFRAKWENKDDGSSIEDEELEDALTAIGYNHAEDRKAKQKQIAEIKANLINTANCKWVKLK